MTTPATTTHVIQSFLDWLSPAKSEQGGLSATEFLNRLQAQTAMEEARHLKPMTELVDVRYFALSSTPGLMTAIDDLLKGRVNIVASRSTKSTAVRRTDISLKMLLQLLDRQSSEALELARSALGRLSQMESVYYDHTYLDSWQPRKFDELTHNHVASPAYLGWAIDVAGRLPHHSQAMLVNFLQSDADLQWRSNHGESLFWSWPQHSGAESVGDVKHPRFHEAGHGFVPFESIPMEWEQYLDSLKKDKKAFEKRLEQSSLYDVKRAMAERPFGAGTAPRQLIDSEGMPWSVFAPWANLGARYDLPAWPFLRAQGHGKALSHAAVREQGRVRRLLGSLLRLPEDRSIESLPANEMCTSNEEVQALKAFSEWMTVADAGLVLRVSAAALDILAAAFLRGSYPSDRCQVCWRHLHSSNRLHCHLHIPKRNVRSDADRLNAWADQFAKKRDSLFRQIAQEPNAKARMERIIQIWNAAGDGPSRAPRSLDEEKRKAMKLTLFKLLKALLLFTKGEVAKRLKVSYRNACKMRDPALHPIEFFGTYFVQQRENNSFHAPDPHHPLNPVRLEDRSKSTSSLDSYQAHDLIYDLLLQRAWCEIRGPQMDAETIRQRNGGKGGGYIPAPPRRGLKIDRIKALQMQKEGKSQAAIAKEFGVSPAAVSLFFKSRSSLA